MSWREPHGSGSARESVGRVPATGSPASVPEPVRGSVSLPGVAGTVGVGGDLPAGSAGSRAGGGGGRTGPEGSARTCSRASISAARASRRENASATCGGSEGVACVVWADALHVETTYKARRTTARAATGARIDGTEFDRKNSSGLTVPRLGRAVHARVRGGANAPPMPRMNCTGLPGKRQYGRDRPA